MGSIRKAWGVNHTVGRLIFATSAPTPYEALETRNSHPLRALAAVPTERHIKNALLYVINKNAARAVHSGYLQIDRQQSLPAELRQGWHKAGCAPPGPPAS